MKKSLITMAIIVLFTVLPLVCTWAQSKTQHGFKAGLNIAKLSGDDTEDLKSKKGFIGGYFLTIYLSELTCIQPELLYTMKGARQTENGIDIKIKLDYLEVPILVKLNMPVAEKGKAYVRSNIFFGPAIAFLLRAKISGEEGGFQAEIDINEYTKNIDFGVVFGGGLDLPLGKAHVSLSIRYSLGLTSIDDTADAGDVRNGVLSFMLGFASPYG